MILSNHPATCVIAGAGSGKSTTLVLRIMFMLAHLGITRDTMTVVSFTRKSCGELREKLIRVAPHWGITITHDESTSLVRTFHSLMAQVACNTLPGATWFENIGRDEEETTDFETAFSSAINDKQATELNTTYIELYNDNAEFKEHVLKMLEIECKRSATEGLDEKDEYKDYLIRLACERDEELVRRTNRRWEEKGAWPIPGVNPEPFVAFQYRGMPFYANGRIEGSNIAVFLGSGPNTKARNDKKRTNGKHPAEAAWFTHQESIGNTGRSTTMSMALGVKRKIVGYGMEYECMHVQDRLEKERLAYLIQCHTGEAKAAPTFEIKLSGEIRRSRLIEQFVSQASFIESIGLEVTDFVNRMAPFRAATIDYHFCHALAHFWVHFERRLQ